MDRRLIFQHINWVLARASPPCSFSGWACSTSIRPAATAWKTSMSVQPSTTSKQLIWGRVRAVRPWWPCMLFDYRHLKTVAWPLMSCSPWCCLVPWCFVAGKTIYGAKRWLLVARVLQFPAQRDWPRSAILHPGGQAPGPGSARSAWAGSSSFSASWPWAWCPSAMAGRERAGPGLGAEHPAHPGLRHDSLFRGV